ncbi:MAG: PD-(D/E)XK nuclease family protein [Phycisphaeraceae bacterium]
MLPSFAKRDSPGEIAQSISGRDYLSWSQVDQMRRCPAKYGFGYVEQSKPAFLPSSLLFGSAIHSALEHHFQQLLEGRLTSQRELMAVFMDEWRRRDNEDPDVPVRFNKSESEASLIELAQRMLAAFLISPLANPQGQIIAVEEKLRGCLKASLPDVVARVDAIWLDRQAMHVIDFKTSRSRWNADKVNESADQLLLYHHMAQSMSRHTGLPIKLHFGVITKGKAPVVQLLDVPVSAGRVERVVNLIEQVWQAIKAGHYYPSPSPMNCSTCPFKSRCPAYGDPVHAAMHSEHVAS